MNRFILVSTKLPQINFNRFYNLTNNLNYASQEKLARNAIKKYSKKSTKTGYYKA